jgi:hypothetical protein
MMIHMPLGKTTTALALLSINSLFAFSLQIRSDRVTLSARESRGEDKFLECDAIEGGELAEFKSAIARSYTYTEPSQSFADEKLFSVETIRQEK